MNKSLRMPTQSQSPADPAHQSVAALPRDRLSVVIGIATTGRAGVVRTTVLHMANLADRPDRVVVSVANPADVDTTGLDDLPFKVDVLHGPKGSSAQRNTVLDHAGDAGIVFFIDDDFLIAEGSVTALRNLFATHEDVVMATGHVLADGLRGPGYDHAEGLSMLERAAPVDADAAPRTVYSTYGCNMAVRGAAVRAYPERFDTILPLYGWLEDLDFSRRMAAFGRIVEDPHLRGVHLATKTGRISGRRLGYSQIANPVYLVRKGTYHWARALKLVTGNVLANSAKSLWPEPWIDRRGRLTGNILAFRDLLRGRCRPGRIHDL